MASTETTRTGGAARGGRRARLDRILDIVLENGHVAVEDLTGQLGVSPATVRRDLESLAAQQLVIRTHGGASAHPGASALPMRYRAARQSAAKDAIAKAAAGMVEPGSVIGLNGGTTTTTLAHELAARAADLAQTAGERIERPTVLVTNALNIAQELAVRDHLQLVVTGGVVRGGSFELVGNWAEKLLEQIRIDVLFLGVNALNVQDGPRTHDESEASISGALVERAGRVVVIADSTKLGRTAFARICPLSRIDTLVTDEAAEESHIAALREAGIEVVVVAAGGDSETREDKEGGR